MSRFIDKLKQASQSEPQPMGFRKEKSASRPRLLLVAEVKDSAAAGVVEGADAVLVEGAVKNSPAKTDLPVGIRFFGGKAGTKGSLILNPGTPEERNCKSKGVEELKAGDVLSIHLPGSGGYGPPTERDPARVERDVIEAKISLESAREDYGIAFNDDMSIDEEETRTLRAKVEQK